MIQRYMPYLSVIIPVYNEERRIRKTLERMLPYLRSQGRTFEILIVDDGSRDRTVEVVAEAALQYPELRLVGDGTNRGRGGAVKFGIRHARGELILETDADGSVADEAIGRFMAQFEADPELDAVFGSRKMEGARIVLWQPWYRVFLGYGFLYLARCAFWMWSTTDFILGFKMYRREAARDIFAHQFDPYYVAEAEKVFVAKLRGHKAIELPVTWTDDPDSRVRPVRDSLRSLKGIAAIYVRLLSGRYR